MSQPTSDLPTSAASSVNNFITHLAANPWLVLLGLLVTILGTVLGVVFYYKTRNTKGLAFTTASSNIISDLSNKLNHIQISYQGNSVNTITVTNLAIWNRGNSVIDNSEISSADPIKIIFDEDILDFEVKHITNSTNLIKLTKFDQKTISFDFDYLGKQDGITISIVHTSKDGKKINLSGTIKGFSKTIRVSSASLSPVNFFSLPFIGSIKIDPASLSIVAALAGSIGLLSSYLSKKASAGHLNSLNDSLFTIAALIYIFMAIAIAYIARHRVPKKLRIDIE